MTQAPAGWYADPQLPGRLRYWSGDAWTEHVHAPSVAPAVPPRGRVNDDGAQLAGWWWRGLALLLDGLVVGVIGALVSLPGQLKLQDEIRGPLDDLQRAIDRGDSPRFGPVIDAYGRGLQDAAWWMLLALVLSVAYYAVMVHLRGATLGKLAVGLRVRPSSGDRPVPWRQAVVRALAFTAPNLIVVLAYTSGQVVLVITLASVASLYGTVDLLWAAWDRRSQTLHDKIAGTIVVKKR